ncbi:VOC family protein [Barrientosiimonas humi]|uniref:VOC family protein n=1 Tax=Barrientosiimonas humi TaxID=999931 RepID=UPI00370DDEA8
MTSRLNPYLAFNGDAATAMRFYHQVLGGDLQISTYDDYDSTEGPTGNHVMHAVLDSAQGYRIMAWDVPNRVPYRPGNTMSIYLSGPDKYLRGYFAQLAVDGTVTLPLTLRPWGDELGSLTDKFGVGWMFKMTGAAP